LQNDTAMDGEEALSPPSPRLNKKDFHSTTSAQYLAREPLGPSPTYYPQILNAWPSFTRLQRQNNPENITKAALGSHTDKSSQKINNDPDPPGLF